MLVRWDGATLLLRAARTGSLELAMSAGQSYDRFVGQVTTVPCTVFQQQERTKPSVVTRFCLSQQANIAEKDNSGRGVPC